MTDDGHTSGESKQQPQLPRLVKRLRQHEWQPSITGYVDCRVCGSTADLSHENVVSGPWQPKEEPKPSDMIKQLCRCPVARKVFDEQETKLRAADTDGRRFESDIRDDALRDARYALEEMKHDCYVVQWRCPACKCENDVCAHDASEHTKAYWADQLPRKRRRITELLQDVVDTLDGITHAVQCIDVPDPWREITRVAEGIETLADKLGTKTKDQAS